MTPATSRTNTLCAASPSRPWACKQPTSSCRGKKRRRFISRGGMRPANSSPHGTSSNTRRSIAARKRPQWAPGDSGRCTLRSSPDRRRAGDLRPPEGVVSRRRQVILEGPQPMRKNEKGSIRLPAVGVLIAFVCVAGYFGWYQKPSQPVTSPGEAGTASTLAPSPPPAAKSTLRTISGTVVQTSDYCGGMAPTDEMLESLRKEKPFPEKELFVRIGTVNKYSSRVLQRFVSDAAGRFKISLPPGIYCVIEASKKDELKLPATTKGNAPADQSSATDEDCLEKWYRTCDKTLKIGKQNLKGVVIQFHHTCKPPCVTGGPPIA